MKTNLPQTTARTWCAVSIKPLKTLALLTAGVLATQLASGQCTPPAAGLVGWWPGDGTTLDAAGANNGSLRNGATYAAGKVGQAFLLDGINDYVELPSVTTRACSNAMTIEAWIWRTTEKESAILSQ